MTNNNQRNTNNVKATIYGSLGTVLAAAIIALLNSMFPGLEEASPDLHDDQPTTGDVYRENAPDVKGKCIQFNSGNGNSIENSDNCPQTNNYNQTKYLYSFNQETQLDLSNSYTEVNEHSTTILQSTNLSYYAEFNNWLIAQGLLSISPMLEGSQSNSALIVNLLNNEVNLSERTYIRRITAGLETGTLLPSDVVTLGYDPRKLVPEQLYFTEEEAGSSLVTLLPLNTAKANKNPAGAAVSKATAEAAINKKIVASAVPPKQPSKYSGCWNVSIPSTGSNFCDFGEHVH